MTIYPEGTMWAATDDGYWPVVRNTRPVVHGQLVLRSDYEPMQAPTREEFEALLARVLELERTAVKAVVVKPD